MAQTILNLITNNSIADGIYIQIKEIIDGVETSVPYRIHGHNMHENSEDSIMLVRKYAPVAHRMHSSNTTIYEGCEMDTWLNETYIARFTQNMQNAMLTANIKILTAENDVYGIARKLFIPSFYEWGYTDGNFAADGIASPYTTTNAKRIVYNESGAAVYTWLRSRYSETNYRNVNTYGTASYGNAAGGFWALPAFDLPSSLSVADEPNEDGTYSLLLPDMPLPGVDFMIKVDESDQPYIAAKVAVEIENATEHQIYLCNNYNDEEPIWETADIGNTHTFMNMTKTADTWCLGLRISAIGEKQVIAYEPFVMWTHKEAEVV